MKTAVQALGRLGCFRPTLLRRLFGALLLAFVLVAAALLTLDFIGFKRGMAQRPAVQALAEALAASLAAVPEARDARLILQARARELNGQRRAGAMLPGDVEFSLWQADGRLLFATPGAAAAERASHWIADAQSGPWRLQLAEPRVGDLTVLSWLSRSLLGSLLLAFPLVLLPLWLALRRGMRPLQSLADVLARRDAQDLSPLGFRPQHEELKPLVAAFDELLARLRAQIGRERAFVQDAAHELRTPMAVVATQAYVLAHAGDALERRQAAAALDAALQRAAHLSRQLLTLATLDQAREPAPEALDLVTLVQEALAQMAQRSLDLGLELSLDAPAQLWVELERSSFESVLLNLMDNALRYVPRGGRVALSLVARPEHLLLQVADDGPGLAPAQREQAFDRFWRGPAASETAGTGLGLSIVRQAVARLGGRVTLAEGLDGRGLACLVVLPLRSLAALELAREQ